MCFLSSLLRRQQVCEIDCDHRPRVECDALSGLAVAMRRGPYHISKASEQRQASDSGFGSRSAATSKALSAVKRILAPAHVTTSSKRATIRANKRYRRENALRSSEVTMTPRYPWILVAGLLMLGQPSAVSPSITAKGSGTCAALAEWARPYRGQSPTLDDIKAFDRGHRLAIFNAVSPGVRAALWREHLTGVRQEQALNALGRTLVNEAIAVATPALYRHEPEAIGAYESWRKRLEAAASPEYRRVFFDLGASPGLAASSASPQETFCDCHTGFDCPGVSCGAPGICTQWAGCGPLGWDLCDRLCKYSTSAGAR